MANQQPQERPAARRPGTNRGCSGRIGVPEADRRGRRGPDRVHRPVRPDHLPVNDQLAGETVVLVPGCIARSGGSADRNSRAEYKVAFERDQIKADTEEGWSVLVQGPVHRVQTEMGSAWAAGLGVTPGGRPEGAVGEHQADPFTGRRIRRT